MVCMSDETPEAVPPNWLELARSCVNQDDFIEVVKAAVAQAKKGDRYARDFVASFVLPKEREPSAATTFKEIRFVDAPERE